MEERIGHTVVFKWKPGISEEEKAEVLARIKQMGEWLIENLGVTDWALEGHIKETDKASRADFIQHCVFPSREALDAHAESDVHYRVVELTREVCDWSAIDWIVRDPA